MGRRRGAGFSVRVFNVDGLWGFELTFLNSRGFVMPPVVTSIQTWASAQEALRAGYAELGIQLETRVLAG